MRYVGQGVRVDSPMGLPLIKPPWGRITAIDLNTGDHVWMVPNGQAPDYVRNHPALAGVDLSGAGNPRIVFRARATDDFGLRGLVLRYTKVSGSGEQFEFTDGEIPLAISRPSAREWRGSTGRSLAELGLHDGDMLVYRAVASDARPGENEASSDA